MEKVTTWIGKLRSRIKVMRSGPVIFIIGCTGTGKSDLGVAIAKKYNGEVISADSMQIYKGLDIATNKITEKEAMGVTHHLMSFVNPSSSGFHVHHFREHGLNVIDVIRSRGHIPVIVGGTTYYVESLMFQNNFIDTPSETSISADLSALSNAELHQLLKENDPESANLVHPNNRARVRRAIEVFRLTGKRKSDHLREQKKSNGGKEFGGQLRFKDSLIISLDASLEVLDHRLDIRVDKMKSLGLRKELELYYDENKVQLENGSFGVLQCIGLKEFIPYLRLPVGERNTVIGDKLFEKGCEEVKLHTRQYSRKQRNWVNSRLIRRRHNGELPSFKKLDTSDVPTFLNNGIKIVEDWMNGKEFREEVMINAESSEDANIVRRCEVCHIDISGTENWNNHVRGKRHKHTVSRAVRQMETSSEK